jgi:hypothetical protein
MVNNPLQRRTVNKANTQQPHQLWILIANSPKQGQVHNLSQPGFIHAVDIKHKGRDLSYKKPKTWNIPTLSNPINK